MFSPRIFFVPYDFIISPVTFNAIIIALSILNSSKYRKILAYGICYLTDAMGTEGI